MTHDIAGRSGGGWRAEGRKGFPKDLFDGLEFRDRRSCVGGRRRGQDMSADLEIELFSALFMKKERERGVY